MMQLQKLEIEREWRSGPNKGQHVGKIVFDGEAGEVLLKLTPELCHRMFLLVAEGVIGTAKEAASALVLEAQAGLATPTTAKAIG